MAFTQSGVCVCLYWLAGSHRKPNISVFNLASQQQLQRHSEGGYDVMFCCLFSFWGLLYAFVELGGLWYPFSLISVLLLAFSWATIVCLCYWKSLVQSDKRFSRSSWGLRAASSETGSEQDSASLTKTEREEEGRVMFVKRPGAEHIYLWERVQMQRITSDGRGEDEMYEGRAEDDCERMEGQTCTA